MATRYSVRGLWCNSEWEGIALLSDEINVEEHLYEIGMAFFDSCSKDITDIQILDLENGEILWDAEDDCDCEDDNCDDDCGFDPYLGCYTDDC